jgi:hypothetical protein
MSTDAVPPLAANMNAAFKKVRASIGATDPEFPPLPRGWTAGERGANGDAAGAALALFFSAFGFFFSRLLLSWPFATSLSRG